jgi:3-oxoacyl-(acyl-carrier-protein) synthase
MKMKAFIKGIGVISPQRMPTSGINFLQDPVNYAGNYLTCIEPDYSLWIGPQQIRRMSRILKMGTGAAMMAISDSSIEKPDGIITGTGYGCLEDTATFLTKVTALNEEAVNPTPFMQSTHNTIGSQIALQLQCRGYNQTYVHSAFSFEHALLDAMMQLSERPGKNILTGGVDELTAVSHSIQTRFGKYRKDLNETLSLFNKQLPGTVAGEGATFFVLSGTSDVDAKASIKAVKTFYNPLDFDINRNIIDFLQENGLNSNHIDLLLAGKSGDILLDQHFEKIISSTFGDSSIGVYKHLCGEYCVSSAFAMALGTTIINQEGIPDIVVLKRVDRPVETVLIYNSYFLHHHSLILLTSCRDIKN